MTELAAPAATSGGNRGRNSLTRKEVINAAFFRDAPATSTKGMICGMVLLYAKEIELEVAARR